MDVKSAFLNGKLKEEVYVKQPSGFESNEFPNHVCKLDKALYRLKQAPRAWSINTKLCKQFAKLMTQKYEISMMGVLTYFLGFQIKQSDKCISINQANYVKDLLRKYDINGASVKTPMVPPNNLGPNLIGKSVNKTQYRGASRPDIQFSTCLCAIYLANPKESHLIVVKRTFRYLIGKSLLVLMKSQLTDYDIIYGKVPIFSNNTSAIAISNNLVLHLRTKRIDIRYHFIRDHILKGDIELHFIPTQYQLADIFTKPLDEPTFKRLIAELGGKSGGHDQISNKDAIIFYCLSNGVKVGFAKIIWDDLLTKLNKKTRKKVVLYRRFISILLEYMMSDSEDESLTILPTKVFSALHWELKPNQPEGPPFTDHMLSFCQLGVSTDQQAPNTSSQAEKKVSQGKKPGAK
ncbi:retrovirus-related pol polyprotein from transposon TNT 1-94 [Tanacetum coccineum]